MKIEQKRLFFGVEVTAPWPDSLPEGRILQEDCRHMTLAFLGATDYSKLQECLGDMPPFSLKLGIVGQFDKCIFLPKRHPRVAAWHVDWLDDDRGLEDLQKRLAAWLQASGFLSESASNEFLPHVTLCRSPFNLKQWSNSFAVLPMMTKDIHLYESLGNLRYVPIKSWPVAAPFEEFEHMADIAFKIRGADLGQIHRHAFTALAFKFPALLSYYSKTEPKEDLDDIIMDLNHIVACADGEIGCPFKAVSFHGDLKQVNEDILEWEMIVDV